MRANQDRVVSNLLARVESALDRHNGAIGRCGASRAAATQVRLQIAVHAGEVTFDGHGVVGAAIDRTFRLSGAPPLKAALAGSLDACAFVVSDWLYSDVVYHHQDARRECHSEDQTGGVDAAGVEREAGTWPTWT
jgi:hypothetical protein